jgi:hypothetical protein
MKLLSKTALLIAGTATLVAAAPASARHDNWGRGEGIDAGDVIAGALIIGGIAAIASAGSNGSRYDQGYGGSYGYDRGYDRNDRRYNDGGYGYNNNGYGSRQAVDQCVRAAQREASRTGWARVTDVSTINRVRGGYEIRGRLVVETRSGGRGGYDRGYDRGYHYDRYNDGYDKGRFSCVTRYGQIDDVRVSGLRGAY